MKQKKIWTPAWEGVIEGWTLKFSARNIWRLIPHHDIEDLRQDGYFIFRMCIAKYPKVTEPKHFLSLYRTCFTNHVHDLSKVRTGESKYKEEESKRKYRQSDPNYTYTSSDEPSKEFQEIEFDLFIEASPKPLKELYEGLCNARYIFFGYLEDRQVGWRETSVGRLRRLFGSSEALILVKEWLDTQGLSVNILCDLGKQP